MMVSEGYISTIKKSVSFNTQDRLDGKIDTLTTIMSKLKAQGKMQQQNTIQRKKRGPSRQNYDQGQDKK